MSQPSPRAPLMPMQPMAPMQPLEPMVPMKPLVPLRPGESRIFDPSDPSASVMTDQSYVPVEEQLTTPVQQYLQPPPAPVQQQPVINLGLSQAPTSNWGGIPRPRVPVRVPRPSGGANKAGAVIAVVVALIVGLAALGSRSSSGSNPVVAIPSSAVSNPPISIGTQQVPPANHSAQSGQSRPTHQSGRTLSLNGTISGERIRVTFIRYANNATTKDTFFGPSKGKRYFAAQFRITNTGSVTYVDSPANGARVIDTNGKTYRTTFLVSKLRVGKVFDAAVSLKAGQSAVGYLVFEVPKNRRIGKVQFAENSGFGQVGTWTFVKS